jgi:2-polyprenyl-3-methyl-5-hydroxy-6-metoxy-1,4-benzoquinol methylase
MSGEAMGLPAFRERYDACLREVRAYVTPEMLEEIASHCAGWRPERFDFRAYLSRSVLRFHRAYAAIVESGARTVCDVGGFWGVFPMVLRDLGFTVTMTEARGYYSRAFDPLFSFLASRGVEVLDYDPFAADGGPARRFDAVTVLAVLEHYPHSLRRFMANVRGLMSESGILYVEVPNIAYWPKRVAFLRHGVSPLPPIEEIWESEVPFIGHHHEFTMAELRTVARLAGLSVVREDYFNYTLANFPVAATLRRPWLHLVPALVPRTRECLAVVCRGA